jgi:uncharacterized protein (DUF4415 family)
MKTKSVKISARTKDLYEKRNRTLDSDSEAPTLPLEKWQHGEIGKFYRPLKTAVSVRIDNDVLAWLKSKGEGHISRVNEILRNAMLSELKR